MALVTLSAATSRSSRKLLGAACLPNACLMSPSTPLSSGASPAAPPFRAGEAGGLGKSSPGGVSATPGILGLRGERGGPLCNGKRIQDYDYVVFQCTQSFSQAAINHFTAKSDQFQISPVASPVTLHHTVWRTWLFIAYSDERL